MIIISWHIKSIPEYLTLSKIDIAFEKEKNICLNVNQKQKTMENYADKPWNNQNAPIERKGAKMFFIIFTGVLAVIYFSLMVFAYYKKWKQRLSCLQGNLFI